MVKRAMVCIIILLGLAQTSSSAQDESKIELGKILVTPRRMEGAGIDESKFPGNATVITQNDIEESDAQNMQELLLKNEGITLIDTAGFGLGSNAGLNLRGIVNSSRTGALVLVNGVKQNTLTGDSVHWQSTPLDHIERIEIVRGGGGTIYGEGALSGVINIITKKGGVKPAEVVLKTEAGSFGQAREHTSFRGKKDMFSYGVDLTRWLVGGYRDFSTSRNSTSDIYLGYDLSDDAKIESNIRYHRDTTYSPGGITQATVEADRRNGGAFGFYDNEIKNFSLHFASRLADTVNLDINTFIKDQHGDSNFGSTFRTITPSKGLGARLGTDIEPWGIKNVIISGLDVERNKAVTGAPTATMSETDRTAWGFYIEDTVSLTDNLSLVGGFRYDRSKYLMDLTFPAFKGTGRFQGRSPKIGLTYNMDKDTDLYLNYSRSYKAPNIEDMDAVLANFVDNVNVRPQLADNYELGLRMRQLKYANLELTYFQTRIDDEILFNPFTFSNDNFDTQRDGMELSLGGPIGSGRLAYYLNYMFVKARFSKGPFDNYRIPITPEHTLKTGLSWKPLKGLTTSFDWVIVSRQFRVNDFNNIMPADNYGYLNLGAQYEKADYNIYLKVQNLTNEEYITFQSSNGTTVAGGENPAPPVNFVAGIEYKF